MVGLQSSLPTKTSPLFFLTHAADKCMPKQVEFIPRRTDIASGSTEFFKPKNVGLLFFSRKAEDYIPYARIEIVHFHDDVL